jgi:hypothetical protein
VYFVFAVASANGKGVDMVLPFEGAIQAFVAGQKHDAADAPCVLSAIRQQFVRIKRLVRTMKIAHAYVNDTRRNLRAFVLKWNKLCLHDFINLWCKI